MAEPFAQTFQSLTTTANPFAGELLIAALDVPLVSIQTEALRSLLTRSGVREQMEAVRRYPRFAPPVQRQLEQSAQALLPSIRQCLISGRGDYDLPAFELARAGETFGLIETLLDVLRSERTGLHEEAVNTLRHLVNRLYEHLHGHKDAGKPPLKNASQIQHLATLALDQSLTHLQELAHAEVVMESLFALSRPGDAIPQKLLAQGTVECRSLAKDLLQTSRHPGVMRFVLDSISKPYPPPRVVDAIQYREDPEFILAMLRWVPKRWTNTQERNLKQLEKLAWLEKGTETLEMIPEDLQVALVTLTSATGLSRETKQELRQWIVRHGSSEARSAALAVLEELNSETVQEIVLGSLESDDPNVQAWATGQLRSHKVPDALQKLIDQLDNPEACVQAVARQELQGFDLECLLSRFESMSPAALANAAKLLQKIDPDCLMRLMYEFHHPIRRRRMRAIRGALAFGWHLEVLPALMQLLKDEDALIRRTTIEVLSRIPGPEILAALVSMQNDPHPRVRDAAEEALARFAQNETPQVLPESLPTR